MRSGADGQAFAMRERADVGQSPARGLRQHQSVIVFGDRDDLVAAREGGIHRRIEEHFAARAHEPHHGGIFIRGNHFTIGAPREARLGLEVDFSAIEIEQLGVDHRQAGLPAGLRGDARDQVFALHVDGFLAADQRRGLEIPRFADLGHDVIRLLLARRVVRDGEHGLYNVDVGVFGLGRQHDDGPRRVRIDHGEVVEIERIAAAADDSRVRACSETSREYHLPSRSCRARRGSRCTDLSGSSSRSAARR